MNQINCIYKAVSQSQVRNNPFDNFFELFCYAVKNFF